MTRVFPAPPIFYDSTSSATERRLIVGVGNPLRRDDGAGPAVIARLAEMELAPGAELLEHHGEGASLLEAWQGYENVTVIDATRGAGPPGALYRLADGAQPPNVFSASSHLFGVAEAVVLARALGRLPVSFTLYGIEGVDFGYGAGLSAPVQARVVSLARRLAAAQIPNSARM